MAMAQLDEKLKALANYRLTAALYDFADALLSGYAAEKTAVACSIMTIWWR